MTGTAAGASPASTVLVVLCALALLSLGAWGWRRAPALAPAALDEQERCLRTRSLRRGSAGCAVAGGVLLLAVAVGVTRG